MNSQLIKRINLLPGWLSIHEGQFLHKVVRSVKKYKGQIVEIGSFQGKSAIYMAKTGQNIVAIDPHEGKLDHGTRFNPTLKAFKKNIKDFRVNNKIKLIQKTSHDASLGWDGPIKFLFIDGLHDEKNAASDYADWSKYLVKGGILAMHDSFCGWPGAQEVALKKIILNDEYSEVGVVGSIVYGKKGRSNLFSKINRFRIRKVILLSYWINEQKNIPKGVSFFLIHRICKVLLVNRYTLERE